MLVEQMMIMLMMMMRRRRRRRRVSRRKLAGSASMGNCPKNFLKELIRGLSMMRGHR